VKNRRYLTGKGPCYRTCFLLAHILAVVDLVSELYTIITYALLQEYMYCSFTGRKVV
jgi:hypothetical protein